MGSQLSDPAPAECVSYLEAIESAARKLKKTGSSALAVVDGRRLVGVISTADIVYRVLAEGHDAWFAKVGDFATTEVLTCDEQDEPTAIRDAMRRARLRAIPKIDADRNFLAMVHMDDLDEADIPQIEISMANLWWDRDDKADQA